jgi:hypothetical protein
MTDTALLAHCSLLTAHCSLLIAHCSLLICKLLYRENRRLPQIAYGFLPQDCQAEGNRGLLKAGGGFLRLSKKSEIFCLTVYIRINIIFIIFIFILIMGILFEIRI